MEWKIVNIFSRISIACPLLLGSLLLITALAVSPAALAQTPTAVSSTYFGATTAVCDQGVTSDNTTCTANSSGEYPTWWPDSAVGGSTPAVSLGAIGKGAQAIWPDIMSDINCLTRVIPTGQTIGHWEYKLTKTGCSVGNLHSVPSFSWGITDSYVAAAQASSIDYSFNYLEVPQWAVCYNYGMGNISYGGPNGTSCSGASRILTYALCDMNSKSDGSGWCPGPEYDPYFGNITYFGQRLVDHYCGFPSTCTTGSNVAIKYYEIVNEPDATDAPYWNTISGVPDWPTLLTQTVILENAITSEYSTDNAGNSPTFTGPAFASLDDSDNTASMCGSTANCGLPSSCPSASGSALYGFLNSCITYGGTTYYGKSLVSVGTFHLYPAYEESKLADSNACKNNGGTTYTTIKCTGNNLITDLRTRLNNFVHASISSTFMTEGSWMENANFTPDTGSALYSDMRAYAARYSLVMAATTSNVVGTTPIGVNTEYWFSWVGNLNYNNSNSNDHLHYGSMCDDGSTSSAWAPNYPCVDALSLVPQDHYGGYAYGKVESWLAGGSITATCTAYTLNGIAGCTDTAGSLWTYSITEPGSTTAVAAWIWDSATTVTCPGVTGCSSLLPGSFVDYETLEGSNITVNYPTVSIAFSQEPILLEN